MNEGRIGFLDGLRGWGSVFVLLYHVFSDGLPTDKVTAARLALLVPFNGLVAVLVFFIVSGFALSFRYFRDGSVDQLARTASGRYVRLAIPVFVACVLVHFAMIVGRVDPLRVYPFSRFLNFDPTTWHLLRFALFDVFLNYRSPETYIGPLWTMTIELIGSYIVLLAVFVVRPWKARIAMLLALAGVLAVVASGDMKMLALFPLGAVLADCFNRGWLDAIPRWLGLCLLASGCAIPAILPYSIPAWALIAAPLLVIGSIAVPEIRRFLSNRLSTKLGIISFPLYLVHGIVIFFVGEPLVRTYPEYHIPVQILTVLLAFAAAWPFIWINSRAIDLSHYVGRLMTRRYSLPSGHSQRH